MKTILAIDDERDLLELIEYNLEKAGYLVLKAKTGAAGIDIARQHHPDLIVLDVMLPEMDGWEVCRRLKSEPRTRQIPIVMVTAKVEESDKVLGLELGADDYVTKPFSPRELLARIRAVLRRAEPEAQASDVVKVSELTIDSRRHSVSVGERRVALTATEFNILRHLAERAGQVVSRENLIAGAIGEESVVVDRTIDVHITSLRKKLGKAARMIETVRGVGYKLTHD
jgi:DNA-binding response OmpR family regulator